MDTTLQTFERITVRETSKGHRIWIQALQSKGITGPFVLPIFKDDAISLHFMADKVTGARKVTQAKGGIVDLQSGKVTKWARGAQSVTVAVNRAAQVITITREGV